MKIYWHDRKNNIHIKKKEMAEFEKAILEGYKIIDGRKISAMAGISGNFIIYFKGKPLDDAYCHFLDLIYKEVEQ